MKFRIIILLFLIATLCTCSTCRVTSVEDATKYTRKGYDTRIAVYKTGLDGLLWGAFLWSHHAQAQVLVENKWKWVGTTGLSDTPTFTVMNNEIHYWRPTDYAAFLKKVKRYY